MVSFYFLSFYYSVFLAFICLSFFPFHLHDGISVCRAHKFGMSVCLVKCRHTSPFIAPSPPSSLLSLLRSLGILRGFGQSRQTHTLNISVNYGKNVEHRWQNMRQREFIIGGFPSSFSDSVKQDSFSKANSCQYFGKAIFGDHFGEIL